MLKGLLRDVVGEILRTTTYRRDIEGKRADISANYPCNASLICAIYRRDIVDISAKYRKNKACIIFSVVETIPNISYFWRFR